MSPSPVLTVSQLSISRSGKKILENISFTLNTGDALAITGLAGCGKTSLGLALAQQLYYQGTITYHLPDGSPIAWVEQQHHFKTLQSTSDLYYQQRFNSYDTEETQTVAESLGHQLETDRELIEEMGIGYLLEEKLIQLSNGENKKLQLLNALLQQRGQEARKQRELGGDELVLGQCRNHQSHAQRGGKEGRADQHQCHE